MAAGSSDTLTALAFILHVGGGTLGLISGTIASVAAKGSPLHRVAGHVFFVSMLVMAAFAVYLAIVMPDQLPNVLIGTFAFYLVATAWLTVRRAENTVGGVEKIALVVIVALCAPFALLSYQLATGAEPFLKSAVPLKGAVMIAIYGFTAVTAIAALADAKVVLAGGIAGAPRLARHLWRMCLGLTLATGSAFTNGLPRLLAGPTHVPAAFFYPQFIPLVLLLYWLIRVRLTNWLKNNNHVLR